MFIKDIIDKIKKGNLDELSDNDINNFEFSREKPKIEFRPVVNACDDVVKSAIRDFIRECRDVCREKN